MVKYAILQNPGHNRVYFNASAKLSINELYFSSKKLSQPISEIKQEIFGGVEYITFSCPDGLVKNDFVLLSRLSFAYAIFELRDNALIPAEKNTSYFFGDDLNMILKYSGKTNEIFTRMMLNLAVFHSGFEARDNLNVFDPVCGKGTTLFESLILGYNAFGVELSDKLAGETESFLKRYLMEGRYKHRTKNDIFGGTNNGEPFKAKRFICELSKNKQDQKSDISIKFELNSTDTKNSGCLYKKKTFHIIAGDLPYGIQHNNTAKGNAMRNPFELLESAVPVWANLLKPDGVIVLSWNTFLLKREIIEDIFIKNGLTMPEPSEYNDFSHRVDQAINRDLIIGIK